jgi:uncharacterized membrane protein YqjE
VNAIRKSAAYKFVQVFVQMRAVKIMLDAVELEELSERLVSVSSESC